MKTSVKVKSPRIDPNPDSQVWQGDHRALLSHGGLYARLWAHQSGGFLGDEADDEPLAQAPAQALAK